jgi:hypothetical protein
MLGRRAEIGTRLADLLHDVQQVLQRPRQPVDLPDHHHVARPEMVEQAMQLRSVPTPARCLLLEQASAPGRREGGTLLRQILTFAGDTTITKSCTTGVRPDGFHI